MWADSLADELTRALREEWAHALGTVPLDIWWANREHERTYTVASWLPSSSRRMALCWYAALDPDVASERVQRAVARAFRGVDDSRRVWLVGTMPLGTDPLAKLSRSRDNDQAARLMLRARERADVPESTSTGGDDEDRPLRNAWQAAYLARSLESAWTGARESWRGEWDSLGRLLVLPTRQAKAWSSLPADLSDARRAHAAFVAALSSAEEAELVLATKPDPLLSHCMAALASDPVPARWADLIAAAEDPTEAYEEGLYTSDERWTILAGKAACARDRPSSLDELLVQMMVAAQAAPEKWAATVARRMRGERDEQAIAKLGAKVAAQLEGPKPNEYKIVKLLKAMADAGGRAEVVPFVEELERRSLRVFRAERFAAGRSKKLLAEDPWPDAELLAALAADGHLDDVRAHLAAAFEEKPPAAELLDLATAVAAVEPGSGPAVAEAMSSALEQLPGSSKDEAKAWLSGSPDD